MMAGIALGFQAPTSAMPMLCVSSALAGLLLLGRRRTRAAGCLLLTFLLGAALGIRTANPTLPPEGDAQVTGVVAGEVDFREEKGQVRVILRDVTLNGERIASGAYWTFYLKTDENIPDFLTPGARISMTAEVYHPQGQRNPHGYDFRQALWQKNILIGLYGAAKLQALPDGLSLYGLAARFNHRMAQTLRDVCGEKAGQLASAVLLGMRDEVPDEEQEQFRRLGIAHILSVSGFHVGVLVALLALLPFGKSRNRWQNRKKRLPMLAAGAVLMATILLPAPFSGTEYMQLDVGDADAAVLRQEKHVLVVDAGEYGGDLASYLRAEHLPVDLLVLTHLHSDHAGGVRELLDEGIPIRRCVMPSGALAADFDEEVLPLLARMEENGTVIETVCRGDILQWAEGKLTVLFPPEGFSASNANDGSMALLVEAEGVKLLLTGDLSARYGQYAAVSADVVKAAHHGSKNGTTQAFLDESAPTAVLVSTKRENAADYLRGITDADVYSTLESGAIIIRMADGHFTIEQFEEMQ